MMVMIIMMMMGCNTNKRHMYVTLTRVIKGDNCDEFWFEENERPLLSPVEAC